jgi:hypothetical protein
MTEAPPGDSLAALAIWPPGVAAPLGDFRLRPPGILSSCAPSLHELAGLADAMLASVCVDGTVRDPVRFGSFRAESQAILNGLSDCFPAEWGGYIAAAAGRSDTPDMPRLPQAGHPALEQTDVFLHCGPLATWPSKATTQHHSVLAAIRNPTWTGFYQQADLLVSDLTTCAGEILGASLAWNRAPTVIFPADLIVCGGEANTIPKNFAYFLPDDVGNSAGQASTVLFSEFYVHRFLGISLPLLKMLVPSLTQPPPPALAAALHLWFRGHDLGHFVSPGGMPQQREVLSSWMYGVLDEVWADVIGYIAASSPTAGALIDDAADLSRLTYLAELLRYVRRGAGWFLDSAAAAVELAALEASGAVHFDRSALTLTWSANLMDTTMADLGRRLIRLLFGEVRGEDVALLDPLNDASSDFAEFLASTVRGDRAGLYDYRYVGFPPCQRPTRR